MKSRKPLIVTLSLAALVVLWAVFRPELLFIDATVNESLPAAASVAGTRGPSASDRVLAAGTFHSGAHETKGDASIYQLADGRRILRLTDFSTSNGPDVRVLLVAASDATDDETVKQAGFVELGKLKGNVGDQNYEIPSDLDITTHRAATIWCNRFKVNFGTAPLKGQVVSAR